MKQNLQLAILRAPIDCPPKKAAASVCYILISGLFQPTKPKRNIETQQEKNNDWAIQAVGRR